MGRAQGAKDFAIRKGTLEYDPATKILSTKQTGGYGGKLGAKRLRPDKNLYKC